MSEVVRHGARATFLLCAVISIASTAQGETSPVAALKTPTVHDAGGGIYAGFTQVRDDLLVPLRFWGPALGTSGSYSYRTTSWDFELRLGLGFAALFDRHATPNIALLPSLETATRLRLWRGRAHELRVGPALSWRELLFYAASWDDSHAYWLGVVSLGPTFQLVTKAGTRDWVLDAALPLAALVSRPERFREYKVDALTDVGFWLTRFADEPELTSVHAYQAARARVTLRGQGRGFRIDPYVAVEVEAFREPVPVMHVSSAVGVEGRTGF